MGFRGRKLEAVLSLCPDVVVLQEVGAADVEALRDDGFAAVWVGDNPRKGLAVVGRRGVAFEIDGCHDPELAYFLPVDVAGCGLDFRLLAVWAFGLRSTTAKRWPLDRALAQYVSFVERRTAVVAGDFNNHPLWDTPTQPVFRRSVDVLEAAGLRSAWHQANRRTHGDEGCGTLYWYRHEDRPYHIDYCFVSADIAVSAATIGPTGSWLRLSDHCPVVVDLARDPDPPS
jgi:exodeoxyribonuclease III